MPPGVNNSAGSRAFSPDGGSSPVACVDVDIFLREVARPHAGPPLPRSQIHDDGNMLRKHFLVRDVFVERMFTPTAADGNSGEPDVDALVIKIDARPPRGGEDTPPVGIGAGEGRFHERGVRDGARDSIGGAIGSCSADLDLDHALRSLTIFDDRERE